MDIVFMCLREGKRLYSVRRQGEELFVGSRDECSRFLDLHNRKVLQEREDERRVPRAAPYQVRTYRATRAHAS